MEKNELKQLLYHYINSLDKSSESNYNRALNNFNKLVKLNIVSSYDWILLHKIICERDVYKKVCSDLNKILEMDRDF